MADAAVDIGVTPGTASPFGCSRTGDTVNFSVFSRHATGMALLLYTLESPGKHWFRLELDPDCQRTGDVWHVRLSGVPPETAYAWQAEGPYDPGNGQRFESAVALLDPHTRALVGTECWMVDANLSQSAPPRCLVVSEDFDWQGDCPPGHDWSDTIIYETHVRGLTVDPSSGSNHPGTFLGVIERIPYFLDLGITALELMPVQEFPENASLPPAAGGSPRLLNYWGYNTAAFFAPKERYSTHHRPGCQVAEFKTMVRALHAAGIEVILDVVFNHTAEGDANGPTLSYRGLDNSIYYLLDPEDRGRYLNYSGCGNTVNCSHPVVRDHVLDCLRYWTTEMHVDGFRFDLASVLTRGPDGRLLADPPLIERIAEDPILHHVKLIAEAWDAGGAYQVGDFPGQRFSEWNGRFRDDVRRYWRGDAGMAGALASRLCGSADLYERSGKQPLHSINFVTCHDGFTLNDLVSYESKHNEPNGEDNRDGSNHDFSANYGVEGPTDDSLIEALRARQIRNLLATLMLSRGVPLLLGGDEFRRTQQGNNNAYCQDNPVSWYDWRLVEDQRALRGFVRRLIDFRKRHPLLRSSEFYSGQDVIWFAPDGRQPVWERTTAFGCIILRRDDDGPLCVLFNPRDEVVTFRLPDGFDHRHWQPAIDTAEDVESPGGGTGALMLSDRSLRVLVAGR